MSSPSNGSSAESQQELEASSVAASLFSEEELLHHPKPVVVKSVSNLSQALRASLSDPVGGSSYLNDQPLSSPGPLSGDAALNYSISFLNSLQYPSLLIKSDDMGVLHVNDAALQFFGYADEGELRKSALLLGDLFPGSKKKLRATVLKHKAMSFQGRRASEPQNVTNRNRTHSSFGGKSPFGSPSKILRAKLSNGLYSWAELTLSEWQPDFLFTNTDRLLLATVRPFNKTDNSSRYKNEFEEIEVLGKGGNGTVWRVRNKLDGEEYAIKKVGLDLSSVRHFSDEGLAREAQVFAKISNHPNIVRYYAAWTESTSAASSDTESDCDESDFGGYSDTTGSSDEMFLGQATTDQLQLIAAGGGRVRARNKKGKRFNSMLYIQMQLCPLQNLRGWIMSRQFDLVDAMKVFRQIVSAVAHIHEKNFTHGDVKPENIFLEDGHVLLGDFGLSRSVVSKLSNLAGDGIDSSTEEGTFLYSCPCGNSSVEGDVFSLGIILIELLVPFSTLMERAVVLSRVREGILPEHEMKSFVGESELIRSLVDLNPQKRPTSNDVLLTLDIWLGGNSSEKMLSRSLDSQSAAVGNLVVNTECFMCSGGPKSAGVARHGCRVSSSNVGGIWAAELEMGEVSGVFGSTCSSLAMGSPLMTPIAPSEMSKVESLENEVEILRSEVARLRGLLAEKESRAERHIISTSAGRPGDEKRNYSLRSCSRGVLF